MHEYRRLVEDQMRAKKIEGYGAQAKLAAMAGVSRQVINTILRDDRDRLIQAPEEKTVNGLAKAFNLKPEVVWTAIAVSMGIPSYVVPTITHEVKAATNEDLLNELADRLRLAASLRSSSTEAAGEDQKKLTAVPDPEPDASGYAGPDPDAYPHPLASDEPGTPPEGQVRRDEQDDAAGDQDDPPEDRG